ncbi:Manganese/iron superoxide dismutase, N-terminal [Pseudocohnilembus persalinus]|uniref:Superoxide dismutase n=1 Tax=Pseudocohnilembus persalinus TaxID=266149 RepID=A0A0V0QU53_PSEPJ|nr:Manganese/iron superoxide dismutase, N-terminal [Pseudocohnilembus persalinus]|eukprot:KRX05778.1 Manganese/iron superoxide dismutase, N-terminal [Pseudocohnilembus persalinus]
MKNVAKQVLKPAKLPELDYKYSQLAPVLSENQLTFHHAKHHNTYVTNLNNIYQQIEEATQKGDMQKVAQLQPALKFNLGGHLNHSVYWKNLAPTSNGGGKLPDSGSAFAKAVQQQFGGLDQLIEQFKQRALGIQGSGWAWLGYDANNKALRLFDLPNQELPEHQGLVPLLTIDMWEHAFYLDYQNVKAKYLDEIWKVVNWKDVESRYNEATQ